MVNSLRAPHHHSFLSHRQDQQRVNGSCRGRRDAPRERGDASRGEGSSTSGRWLGPSERWRESRHPSFPSRPVPRRDDIGLGRVATRGPERQPSPTMRSFAIVAPSSRAGGHGTAFCRTSLRPFPAANCIQRDDVAGAIEPTRLKLAGQLSHDIEPAPPWLPACERWPAPLGRHRFGERSPRRTKPKTSPCLESSFFAFRSVFLRRSATLGARSRPTCRHPRPQTPRRARRPRSGDPA